jgi:hypothetical protein
MANEPLIRMGTFIRVRADHADPARAGKDGMAIQPVMTESEEIALVFGYDRHNQPQDCECVGPEMWERSELDLSTLER